MNHCQSYFTAGLLAACGLAVLLYWGLSAASFRVFSVAEFLAYSGSGGEEVQVYGRAVRADVFLLELADWESPGKVMSVRPAGGGAFLGARPQPGMDLFVTGRFNRQAGCFEAREVISSCPAKYEARRPEPDGPAQSGAEALAARRAQALTDPAAESALSAPMATEAGSAAGPGAAAQAVFPLTGAGLTTEHDAGLYADPDAGAAAACVTAPARSNPSVPAGVTALLPVAP